MTDASEARDVLPILFLGTGDRFIQNEDADQQLRARAHDFRPMVLPADTPLPGRHLDHGPHSPAAKRELQEQEEESGPKVSPVIGPASGSEGASPTSPSENSEDPADAKKGPTTPALTPPQI